MASLEPGQILRSRQPLRLNTLKSNDVSHIEIHLRGWSESNRDNQMFYSSTQDKPSLSNLNYAGTNSTSTYQSKLFDAGTNMFLLSWSTIDLTFHRIKLTYAICVLMHDTKRYSLVFALEDADSILRNVG